MNNKPYYPIISENHTAQNNIIIDPEILDITQDHIFRKVNNLLDIHNSLHNNV